MEKDIGVSPASPGSDFVEATGQITFEEGSTSVVVPITIIDDELAEAFDVILSLMTGAGLVPGISCKSTIYYGDSAASSLGLSSVLVSVAMSGLWWLYNL